MAVPGVLMILAQPADNSSPLRATDTPPAPNVEAVYSLSADDSKTPSRNTVYFLSDITPILSSSSHYDEYVRAHSSHLSSISWVVCAFINGRDPPNGTADRPRTEPHVPPTPPATGSVLVINGSTPRTDKEEDYHAWYDQEHGAKLTKVPGWTSARRYSLAKVYGEAETANFYGFNFYEAENGLGGPEWQAGVTEWTMRIRSNAAKPNIRRVWRVDGVSAA